ncbi:ATP-dependent helicase [Photobacterium kishitanii]|uniref:DNA 3'-5' helicase n=1 Tax=Photobacterium kishitanii TaxID=318456 RepID=A0A2T3KMN6_9GAMM|nr:UvrD-helicase domain-containing protein [Photobacterium kishitanii]PSV01060.1 hypothetical protein C9J27_03315 [Photobacterium kishitanii]
MNIQEAYNRLNKKQKNIVKSNSLRLLVLAGAGTGKTSSIVVRITKHLSNDGFLPENIVALTFSNKAARELKERVELIVGKSKCEGMFIGTFHAFCVRVLKNFYEEALLTENFQILDSDDQKSLIKTIIKARELKIIDEIKRKTHKKEDIDSIKSEFKTHLGMTKNIIAVLSEFKNNELPLTHLANRFLDFNVPAEYALLYAAIINDYENKKNAVGVVDFDDLIVKTNFIFSEHEWIKKEFGKRIKAVLVDEYQDTSKVQSTLISNICSQESFLTVIGDDDQSIYGWRGAYIDNILGFGERENAQVIKLEQNYRSSQIILSAANSIIKNNKHRLGKSLWTDNIGIEKITTITCYNNFEEGDYVAAKVKKLIEDGSSPSSIAILYRKNFMSSTIEGAFHKSQIPYKVYGGLSFWQRTEIKDFMALLKWVRNPDQSLSIKRYLTLIKIGYGELKHIAINRLSEENNTTYETELINFAFNGKSNRTKEGLKAIISMINNARTIYREEGLHKLTIYLSDACNIADSYKKIKDPEKIIEMMQNIAALSDMTEHFISESDVSSQVANDDLTAFLISADLQLDGVEEKEEKNLVSIMTIHAAKGLEFSYVFLIGVDEGHFPSERIFDITEMEEERRIAYVAVTRAKEKLWISCANNRLGKPTQGESQFTKEIPQELINKERLVRKLF